MMSMLPTLPPVVDLIAHYGYAALALGCLLEGETVLLAAGFAAHRGLLDWPWVVLVAWVFAVLGDLGWFALGRRLGSELDMHFPHLATQRGRVETLLMRHPNALVLSMRFLVGLRSAIPLLLGASPFPLARFAALNFVGALGWVLLVGSLGYGGGEILARLLPELKHLEGMLLVALLGAGVILKILHRRHTR